MSSLRISCPEGCGLEASRADNLRRHLSTVHSYTQQQIEDFNRKLKLSKKSNRSGIVYKCKICSKEYTAEQSMHNHFIKEHKDVTNRTDHFEKFLCDPSLKVSELAGPSFPKANACRLACPIVDCKIKVTDRIELIRHFASDHKTNDKSYNLESVEFATEQELEDYISRKCEATCTSLIDDKKCCDGESTIKYMRCSMEGCYTRKPNSVHDSKKIVKFCSAYLKVSINHKTSKYSAMGTFCHNSHNLEWAKQNLTKNQTDIIVNLCKDGFYNNQILDKLRRTYDANNRLYYVDNDQIRSIRKSHELYPGRLHEDDLMSIKMLAERNDPADGVRLVILPTEENNHALKIVIITPQHFQNLKQHGHRGILADDTHHVSKYDAKLTTLMVPNDNDRGLPAGFLISNTTTSADIALLFGEVKKLFDEDGSTFCPRQLMTDEAHVFWNGYVQDVQLSALLDKLHSMLKTNDVGILNHEINELFSFLNNIKSAGALQFSQYFYTYYYQNQKLERWAAAYRDYAVFHTSMFVESWHSILKLDFLANKRVIRLDQLIYSLKEGCETIKHRRFVEEQRGLAKANPRQLVQKSRHETAEKEIDKYIIEKIPDREGQPAFRLTSNHPTPLQVPSIVKIGNCFCNAINGHCKRCDACPYSLRCTCKDTLAGVCCKHSHMLKIHLARTPASVDEVETQQEILDDNDDIIDLDDEENMVPDLETLEIVVDYNELEVQKRKDEMSADFTYAQGVFNRAENELRKMRRDPDDETIEKNRKIMEAVKLLESLLDDQNVLTVRRDIQQSARAKRKSARDTMNNYSFGPKRKSKRVEFDPNNPYFSYEPDEMTVCNLCKKSLPVESSSRAVVNCVGCGAPAYFSCVSAGIICLSCQLPFQE
ncbi:unnamed protein product [Caenorhabditis angaria]|uniref:C2H2-type domain-containing protein n=1 Tax=Caenorhabditis angaria TaxID=860376 RepID=A0A9P1ISU3_9PELO|nr:unnamed protein product [Caenorhabditis angaria]